MGCGASKATESKFIFIKGTSQPAPTSQPEKPAAVEMKSADVSTKTTIELKDSEIAALKKCKALYEYKKKSEDGVNLKMGEIVGILDDSDADWWTVVKLSSKEQGSVPSNFLEPYTEDAVEVVENLEFYINNIDFISRVFKEENVNRCCF